MTKCLTLSGRHIWAADRAAPQPDELVAVDVEAAPLATKRVRYDG